MAAAANLNLVYRPGFARYCVYSHEISQVDSVYGSTYESTLTLNQNKIHDGGRHLGFLHQHK